MITCAVNGSMWWLPCLAIIVAWFVGFYLGSALTSDRYAPSVTNRYRKALQEVEDLGRYSSRADEAAASNIAAAALNQEGS